MTEGGTVTWKAQKVRRMVKQHFTMADAAVEKSMGIAACPTRRTETKRGGSRRYGRDKPWKTLQLRRAWG